MNLVNDDEHYKALVNREAKMTGNMILTEIMIYFQ